jgi:hypothetical protein
MYHLTFQFKSNERPWSGCHQARGVETDEAARKWATYFVDKIGDDYQITLFKNGVVMPLTEADADRAGNCEQCDGTGCTDCQGDGDEADAMTHDHYQRAGR